MTRGPEVPAAGGTTWLDAVGRRLGGPAEIVRRTALAGGYATAGVERVELRVGEREVSVVSTPKITGTPVWRPASIKPRAHSPAT